MGFLERYGWFIVLGLIILVFLWSKLKPYLRELQDKWERQQEIANFGKCLMCLAIRILFLFSISTNCTDYSVQVNFLLSVNPADPVKAASQQERMEEARRRWQEKQDAKAAKFIEDKIQVLSK